MEEQLATPLSELVALHLFISSLTLLLGAVVLGLLMKAKSNFKWSRFITHSVLILGLAIILSILIWEKWPFGFDIMIGPLNLPTLAALTLILGVYELVMKSGLRRDG